MPVSHLLLALLVVIVWGVNFIFVKLGLEEFSPLLLCSVRFFLASIPAIFFINLPAVSFRLVAAYGLVMFALQFALIFSGMHAGMTAGMASILMQTQVFFSMFFAAVLLGERPNISQITGALVSFSGIVLVGMHFDQTISLTGFLFILAGAASWGLGNLITKKLGSVNMLALVVWGSLVAAIPMLFLSLVIEGSDNIVYTWNHLSMKGISSLFYIVYASTWVGYGVWNWLLGRYPVSTIVPFSLLVPVAGVVSSVLMLNEPFQLWKLTAGILVISGLCINLIGTRFFESKLQAEPA